MKTLALIACSGSKRPIAAFASQMYTGQLFKRSVAYAESQGLDWRVLSAHYILLKPFDVIEPYNVSLADMTAFERRQWGRKVAYRLEKLYCGEKDVRLILLAGEMYAGFTQFPQGRMGTTFHVERPLRGMGIGKQLQWLTDQASEGRVLHSSPDITPSAKRGDAPK